ncbi:MAG: hypothetical protein HPZ91_02245 [Lentisphaeria bacterium]|nr:hypothetical protein [Lentisphaeria bacterium]
MKFRCRCSNCSRDVEADDSSAAEMDARCPFCGRIFRFREVIDALRNAERSFEFRRLKYRALTLFLAGLFLFVAGFGAFFTAYELPFHPLVMEMIPALLFMGSYLCFFLAYRCLAICRHYFYWMNFFGKCAAFVCGLLLGAFGVLYPEFFINSVIGFVMGAVSGLLLGYAPGLVAGAVAAYFIRPTERSIRE